MASADGERHAIAADDLTVCSVSPQPLDPEQIRSVLFFLLVSHVDRVTNSFNLWTRVVRSGAGKLEGAHEIMRKRAVAWPLCTAISSSCRQMAVSLTKPSLPEDTKDVTNTYRSFDGRRATLADLIAHLRYVSADLVAAAAAGIIEDPVAAQGLARVIDHHRQQLEGEFAVEADGGCAGNAA